MSNTAIPPPNSKPDSRRLVATDTQPTAVQQIQDTTMETAGQKKQGEEEALESHEVIELQAFSEKKPWIEERIRVSRFRMLLSLLPDSSSSWKECLLWRCL